MTTRIIKTEQDRTVLIQFIKAHKLPFTANVTKGKSRSVAQNSLQRMWLNEAAEQLEDRTAEEIRGHCKLTIGVPMLRAENDEFRAKYDAIVRPLPYEQKLAIMMEPLDLPVTRIMTTSQKTRFLDAMSQHLIEQGIVLTDPEGRRAA